MPADQGIEYAATVLDGLGNRIQFRLCTACARRMEVQRGQGETPELILRHLQSAIEHLAIARLVGELAGGDWLLQELSRQIWDIASDVNQTYLLAGQAGQLRALNRLYPDDPG